MRAVLARPRGADPTRFEGVYLHNAGGPMDLGPVLWTLMRDRYRFDAADFSREMIDENLAGWSNIYCLGGPLAKTWDGRTKITVEQHQENFDADIEDPGPTSFQADVHREIPGITTPPIDDTSDNWGADLVYVVGADGLSILLSEHSGGPYSLVVTLPWGDEPDWDAVDDTLNEAYGHAEVAGDADGDADDEDDEDDEDDDGDEDEDDADADELDDDCDGEAPYAHETPASLEVVAASARLVQQGKIAAAQKMLLGYLDKGGAKTPAVLANLFFTLSQMPLPAARQAALVEEVLAAMADTPTLLGAALIDNLCIVMNNLGRGADSLRVCELAMQHGKQLSANCYVGFTYGAYASQEPQVMRRAIEHVERAMGEKPELLAENPAVFDNTAGLYVALGNKAKALEYVQLCKLHRYENFAAMPSMPEYASLKDDPEFVKLFRR